MRKLRPREEGGHPGSNSSTRARVPSPLFTLLSFPQATRPQPRGILWPPLHVERGPKLRKEGRGESPGPELSWGGPRGSSRNLSQRAAIHLGGEGPSNLDGPQLPSSKSSTEKRKHLHPGPSTRKGNLLRISAASWSPGRIRLSCPSSSHLHWPARPSSREAGPLQGEARKKA